MSPPPKPRTKRRLLTVCLLALFGAVAMAGGIMGMLSERDLRARALTAEAEVVGYTRLVSARGGGLVGDPNALDLRYRDVGGAMQKAKMMRAGNDDLAIGSRFPVLYDPQDAGRIRRADRPVQTGILWALAGGGAAMVLLGLALVPGLRRAARTTAGSQPRDLGPLPPDGTPHRFFALAGRPLLETRTAAGGADLFALDRTTGAFLPARDLWPRLRDGAADLDEIGEDLFRQIGREWRRRAMESRTMQPVTWQATGDAEYPWRATLDGHETRIRINDFPAEPLYSVIVADQSVGELDDWPPAWVKPL